MSMAFMVREFALLKLQSMGVMVNTIALLLLLQQTAASPSSPCFISVQQVLHLLAWDTY